MVLKSKCILAPQEKEDEERISIMSRHTLNDGITPDSRISTNLYTKHDTILAPNPKLIGAYYKEEIHFDEYAKTYTEYLKEISEYIVENLIKPAITNNITILCIEENPTFCHRKLLIEFSKKIAESLHLNLKTEIG